MTLPGGKWLGWLLVASLALNLFGGGILVGGWIRDWRQPPEARRAFHMGPPRLNILRMAERLPEPARAEARAILESRGAEIGEAIRALRTTPSSPSPSTRRGWARVSKSCAPAPARPMPWCTRQWRSWRNASTRRRGARLPRPCSAATAVIAATVTNRSRGSNTGQPCMLACSRLSLRALTCERRAGHADYRNRHHPLRRAGRRRLRDRSVICGPEAS